MAVCLWVVAGGDVTSDLEHFKEVLPEFRDELGSTVADDTIGKAMMSHTSRMTISAVSSLEISLVHGRK